MPVGTLSRPVRWTRIGDQWVGLSAVPNMPGRHAHTSSKMLAAATLPYLLKMANEGPITATGEDSALQAGLVMVKGEIVHPKFQQTS